jgi:HEAT repeats
VGVTYTVQRVRTRKYKALLAKIPSKCVLPCSWLHALAVLVVLALVVGCERGKSVSMDIKEKLRSNDPAVRYQAVSALSTNENHASILLLIDALSDTNRGIRIEAAETLGKWKAKEATGSLIRALGDSEMWVRAQAAAALGEIRAEAAVKPLIDLIDRVGRAAPQAPVSTTSYGQDARAAAFALKQITGKDFGLDMQKWNTWLAETNQAKQK